MFQSRNRGSFGFKQTRSVHYTRQPSHQCFNLVIEVLLVSRRNPDPRKRYGAGFNLVIEVLLVSSSEQTLSPVSCSQFQSRNRGSFGFKKIRCVTTTL